MKLNYIFSLLIGAGIIQGIFLAVIILSKKSDNKKGNVILSVMLVIFSLSLLHSIFNIIYYDYAKLSAIKIKEPFQLLIGPLLFLYIREISAVKRKIKIIDLIHFIPAIIYGIGIIIIFYFNLFSNTEKILNIILWSVIVIHFFIYLINIHMIIKNHRIKIKNNYSSIEKINLIWINFISWIFFILYIVFLIMTIMLVHTKPYFHFYIITAVLISATVYIIGYKALLMPEIFQVLKNKNNIKQKKYEKTGLKESDSKKILDSLLELMKIKRPFLNPVITISDLSKMLKINRNQLSQVINENLNQNFYDFINSYRINEFKTLVQNPDNDKYTLLGLALDSGFNSKPSFNKIFKQAIGITPSQYKKQLKK